MPPKVSQFEFLKNGGDLPAAHWCDPNTPLEALGLIKRNLLGPPKVANPSGFLSKMSTLNAITPKLKVGFTGDAMMMFDKPLSFDDSIKEFYTDCNAVVANMEWVITDHPKKRGRIKSMGSRSSRSGNTVV